MRGRHALARSLYLAVCLAGLVVVAAALGVGFDGVGDDRWAIVGLVAALALCWFDRPATVGAASLARQSWGWRLSGSGLLLALALAAAWLAPRTSDVIPDEPLVETWLRNDATNADWPILSARGKLPTRVVDAAGPGEGDGLEKRWTLTPEIPTFLRLTNDPPIDEPFVGWSMPPAQLQISEIPAARRGTAWLTHLAAKHPSRLAFNNSGVSIGGALSPTVPSAPFPVGGIATPYRIAKPFNRSTLTWSAGEFTLRAEAAHLLPADGLPASIPPGSTPLVGLNAGSSSQFMPLVPVLVDDRGRLAAVRPTGIADEPVAIDLLNEGQSETGPALLEGWLRQARSRAASAPGFVVVPRELPWRRAFTGSEVAWSRGSPRPTPRPSESRSGWETLLVVISGVVLVRLALRED